MGRETTVRDNYQRFMEHFHGALERTGRAQSDVAVVAVSKQRSVEEIKAVVACGARIIGENRIQEAKTKFAEGMIASDRGFSLHMIGHLQRNKAKDAVELFELIQSVDSYRIAEAIDNVAGKLGKKQRILVEVNSSGEEQKYGFPPERTAEAVANLVELRNLSVSGLMTVGPLTDDEIEIRRAFADTYKLFQDLRRQFYGFEALTELSMGMTDDFELAIAEGSTMIRVGRAIFGPREK